MLGLTLWYVIKFMIPSIIDLLKIISNKENSKQRFEATMLLKCMQSFDFVFNLLLMKMYLDLHVSYHKHYKKKKRTKTL